MKARALIGLLALVVLSLLVWELRWVLLGLLAAVLIGEQLISLRLSYHPEVAR